MTTAAGEGARATTANRPRFTVAFRSTRRASKNARRMRRAFFSALYIQYDKFRGVNVGFPRDLYLLLGEWDECDL